MNGLGLATAFTLALSAFQPNAVWGESAMGGGLSMGVPVDLGPRKQYELGQKYFFGTGVTEDYPMAANWFRAAAGQGDVPAQVNLGVMYRNDDGVTQACVLAHMWFNIAAAKGDADAKERRDALVPKMVSQDVSLAQASARICMKSAHKTCDR